MSAQNPSGKEFVAAWRDTAAYLEANHAYDPAQEHDSCGVGLVAAIDGKPRRQVVEAGIEALKALWHRGAVDADGKTGDGAGIHVQIPQDFFKEHIRNTGHEPGQRRLAVDGGDEADATRIVLVRGVVQPVARQPLRVVTPFLDKTPIVTHASRSASRIAMFG